MTRPNGALSLLLLLLASLLAACDGTVSVTFLTGPQTFEVDASDLPLPPALRDDQGRIRIVPCAPTRMCTATEELPVTCEAGVCDPGPKTISGPVGNVIDADALLSETAEIGLRAVDTYEVEAVNYRVELNTSSVDLPPVEVYWGPEAATAIDPALGVTRFGTLPAIAAGTTGTGALDVDAAGASALADYLVTRGERVRLFARTTIDVEPGDRFPEGSLRVSVNATIRAIGRVLD